MILIEFLYHNVLIGLEIKLLILVCFFTFNLNLFYAEYISEPEVFVFSVHSGISLILQFLSL